MQGCPIILLSCFRTKNSDEERAASLAMPMPVTAVPLRFQTFARYIFIKVQNGAVIIYQSGVA